MRMGGNEAPRWYCEGCPPQAHTGLADRDPRSGLTRLSFLPALTPNLRHLPGWRAQQAATLENTLAAAYKVKPTHGQASLVAQTVECPPANPGDLGLITGLGRSPGEWHGYPLQYSCLEYPMDREAWQATVHGVARVWHDLVTKERERTQSSTLAWKIPWTEEPGGLQSIAFQSWLWLSN